MKQTDRVELERRERSFLAPFAVFSSDATRESGDLPDEHRLAFQIDRERVTHSSALRRLQDKRQVVPSGSGDHYTVRLTHTMEVSSIARSIARRLMVNEDLCEAIAYSHDLGHTPFGHAGEEILNEKLMKCGLSFEHNEQSVRLARKMRLTDQVIDGLDKHKTVFDQAGKAGGQSHLEGQIVNAADEIAYTAHDARDGWRRGVLEIEKLKGLRLWQEAEKRVVDAGKMGKIQYIANVAKKMVGLLVDDFCAQTVKNINKNNIRTSDDIRGFGGPIGVFSDEMRGMLDEFRGYLMSDFYGSDEVIAANKYDKRLVSELFDYYMKNPDMLPSGFEPEDMSLKAKAAAIRDYISGMTDEYCIIKHDDLSKM
ncbi:MAG: HD domain-containing protein [Candidatus Peregrinibacteria bacterium]